METEVCQLFLNIKQLVLEIKYDFLVLCPLPEVVSPVRPELIKLLPWIGLCRPDNDNEVEVAKFL